MRASFRESFASEKLTILSRSDGDGVEDKVHECYVENLPLASIVIVCIEDGRRVTAPRVSRGWG